MLSHFISLTSQQRKRKLTAVDCPLVRNEMLSLILYNCLLQVWKLKRFAQNRCRFVLVFVGLEFQPLKNIEGPIDNVFFSVCNKRT